MTTTRHNQSGFTLIETLIAILILSLTIGALLTLTAGGFFSIRYAKNDIVAANLLQESLEYVRNTRDSTSQSSTGASWDQWITTYQDNGCFSADGCLINPYASDPLDAVYSCSGDCDHITYFTDVGFYGYVGHGSNYFDTMAGSNVITTSFVRKVTMRLQTIPTAPDPELVVTARMDWLNGTNPKHTQQSIILTKWNLR